jgi:hypothetical protein
MELPLSRDKLMISALLIILSKGNGRDLDRLHLLILLGDIFMNKSNKSQKKLLKQKTH